MKLILIKVVSIAFIVFAVIFYLDVRGYFNASELNDHVMRKWNSFYEFSKKNNVDIIMFGNSRLYTGIEPHTLSASLGVNCFILAAPGTNIADAYYGLLEAVEVTNPKMVVIETTGINSTVNSKLEGGALSEQLKSFSSRKNLLIKIKSSPKLFALDNIPYAWSNTLRNHNYIFTNREQLKENREKIKNNYKAPETGLYLGRFVRFRTGLTDSLLNKYEKEGPSVDGNDFSISDQNKDYVKKIVALCNEKGIDLIFLTIPMYHKHVTNYSHWKKVLGDELKQYNKPWLDLQDPYDMENFTAECFENTYAKNQHMTYNGALLVSYKLKDFIEKNFSGRLPNRKTDSKWLTLFYGGEGYFENNSPLPNDRTNKVLAKNVNYGLGIKEINFLNRGSYSEILVKVNMNQDSTSLKKSKLRMQVTVHDKKNQIQKGLLEVPFDPFHCPKGYVIFKHFIPPVNNIEIENLTFVPGTTIP